MNSESTPPTPTPLSRLIDEARRDRSLRAVATAGGISPSTLRYYHGERWPAIRLPAPEVMQAIADGLRIPLARVQKACLESLEHGRGRQPESLGEIPMSTPQAMVITMMDKMTIAQQEAVSDIINRLTDILFSDPGDTDTTGGSTRSGDLTLC